MTLRVDARAVADVVDDQVWWALQQKKQLLASVEPADHGASARPDPDAPRPPSARCEPARLRRPGSADVARREHAGVARLQALVDDHAAVLHFEARLLRELGARPHADAEDHADPRAASPPSSVTPSASIEVGFLPRWNSTPLPAVALEDGVADLGPEDARERHLVRGDDGDLGLAPAQRGLAACPSPMKLGADHDHAHARLHAQDDALAVALACAARAACGRPAPAAGAARAAPRGDEQRGRTMTTATARQRERASAFAERDHRERRA